MTYTRLNQPSIVEQRYAEIADLGDAFLKYCVDHANFWKITKEEAEDLAQETMRKALVTVGNKGNVKYANNHNMMAYLRASVRKNLKDVYKAKYTCHQVMRRELSLSHVEQQDSTPIGHRFYEIERHPLNLLIFQKVKEIVNRIISQKSKQIQEIWAMCIQGHFSNEEIAIRVRLNHNNLNAKLFRLRKIVKQALRSEELDLEHFVMGENDDCPRNAYLVNHGVKVYSERVVSKRRKRKNVC